MRRSSITTATVINELQICVVQVTTHIRTDRFVTVINFS